MSIRLLKQFEVRLMLDHLQRIVGRVFGYAGTLYSEFKPCLRGFMLACLGLWALACLRVCVLGFSAAHLRDCVFVCLCDCGLMCDIYVCRGMCLFWIRSVNNITRALGHIFWKPFFFCVMQPWQQVWHVVPRHPERFHDWIELDSRCNGQHAQVEHGIMWFATWEDVVGDRLCCDRTDTVAESKQNLDFCNTCLR